MVHHREGILQPGSRRDPTQFQRVKDAAMKYDQDKMELRDAILRKAEGGDEDALAYVRDELRVTMWVQKGKKLILKGVLVGARPR